MRFDVPAMASGGRARGGLVITLWNNVFENSRAQVLFNEEYLLAIEVSAASQCFIIANVYAPIFSPGFSSEVLRTISLQLDVLTEQFPTTPIVIAGIVVSIPSLVPVSWICIPQSILNSCRRFQRSFVHSSAVTCRYPPPSPGHGFGLTRFSQISNLWNIGMPSRDSWAHQTRQETCHQQGCRQI